MNRLKNVVNDLTFYFSLNVKHIFQIQVFDLGIFPMGNGDFRQIIHGNTTIGNILDIFHINQKGSVRSQEIPAAGQLPAQFIQTSHTLQYLSILHMKKQSPSDDFTIL